MTHHNTVDQTLDEREATYGCFEFHAAIAQALKAEMWCTGAWEDLDPDMKEALEMIQHKIARILNGDPCKADSWHDIAGYSRLVERRLLYDQHDSPVPSGEGSEELKRARELQALNSREPTPAEVASIRRALAPYEGPEPHLGVA